MCSWKLCIPTPFFLFVILMLAGCNSTPESVVKSYLDNTFLDNNGKKAYAYLSAEDKQYVGKEEFCRELNRKNVLNKKILEKYENFFNYEIIETKKTQDTIYVTVEISRPNAVNVLSEIVSFAMLTAFGELSEKERAAAIKQKFDKMMMSKDRLLVQEERVFKVLPEKDGYKIYLNLGYPEKMKKLEAEAAKVTTEAAEYERVNDYDRAIDLYGKALKIKYDKGIEERKQKLEKVRESTLSLGQSRIFGYLKFTPEKIEKKRLPVFYSDDSLKRSQLSDQEYLLLSFSVKNVSEGQVFSIGGNSEQSTKSMVSDNFGNIWQEIGLNFGDKLIMEKDLYKLRPGEEKSFKAVCEAPLAENAESFIWKIKLNTNNRNETELAYVKFFKADINTIQLLAKN